MTQPSDNRSCHPIGVFDSGLGGLRVLDRLMQALPDERFVYMGDTLYMPYGEKSHAQVRERVAASLDWMFETHRVKLMVVACNTAAAVASALFERYAPVPFVDPVSPICRYIRGEARFSKVGLMATPATVASNRYPQLLADCGRDIELVPVACDGLASIIEAGQDKSAECEALLRRYLQPLEAAAVEAVILGCTHYPYVQDQIEALATWTEILNPAVFMVDEVRHLLGAHDLICREPAGRRRAEAAYYVTAEPERFYETSRRMPFTYNTLDVRLPDVVTLPAPSRTGG